MPTRVIPCVCRACRVTGDWGLRSALSTQGALGCSSWVEKPLSFLICLEVCKRYLTSGACHERTRADCTSGVCPDATANGEMVSISVDDNHPLLQLKRALPWEAALRDHEAPWAAGGQKHRWPTWFAWDVSLYVPLVVLMLVKNLNARDMEAYLAENARGAGVHRTSGRPHTTDSGSFQHCTGLCGPGQGRRGRGQCGDVACRPKAWGLPIPVSSRPIPPRRSCPSAYPNEPGYLAGCGAALWSRLVEAQNRAACWGPIRPSSRSRRSSGRSKNTTCLPRAHRKSARC